MRIKQINNHQYINRKFNIEFSHKFADCELLDIAISSIKPKVGSLCREAYSRKEIAMMIAAILISFGLPISYALYHTKVLREELDARPDLIAKGRELVESKSPEIQEKVNKIVSTIKNEQTQLNQEELLNDSKKQDAVQKDVYQPCEITEEIINAVISMEYDSRKQVSSKGATGLMQIMPKTWEDINKNEFGGKFPFKTYAKNDKINKMFGTAYLKSIKKYLDSHKSEWKTDELPLIFACYFGGWGNVRKAGFDPSKIKTKLPLTHDYMVRGSNLIGYNSDNL